MKWHGAMMNVLPTPVAPLAGAWIEMIKGKHYTNKRAVAPLAGAWIEICSAWWLCVLALVAPRKGCVD